MGSILGLILIGFGLGVLFVVAAEALGLIWIMKRLRQKINTDQAYFSSQTLSNALLDPQQSLHFAFKKQVCYWNAAIPLFHYVCSLKFFSSAFQGVVWVLESGKISKTSGEQKRKMEILEVSPVKMYGQIKGQSLILREPDGSHTTIELKGCAVQAVSASVLSSRKW